MSTRIRSLLWSTVDFNLHYNKAMDEIYSTLVKIRLTHIESRTKIMSFEKVPKVCDAPTNPHGRIFSYWCSPSLQVVCPKAVVTIIPIC